MFAAVGIPESTPPSLKLKPSGRVLPLARFHVMLLPVAVRVCLYSVSTVPFGRVVVVIFGAVITVPLPPTSPVSVPLLIMVPLLVRLPLQFSEEPSGTVRVSSVPISKSSCKVTSP